MTSRSLFANTLRLRGSVLQPIAIALALLVIAIPAGMAVFDWTAGVMDRRYLRRLTTGHEGTRRLAMVQAQEFSTDQIRRLQSLARGMLFDRSPLQRARALYALSALGGRELRHEIEQALRHDPVELVRFAAATSLTRMGAREAVPSLCQALQDDGRVVRWAAARALGSYPLNESFPHVIWCLPRGPDRSPLMELAFQASLEPAQQRHWLWLLGSGVAVDHRIAHRALTIIGYSDAAPAIAADLRHQDPTVRASACTAIALLGHSGFLAQIKSLLADPDVRVRANALRAMGILRDPAIVPLCREFMSRSASRELRPEREVRGPVALFEGPRGETLRLPFRSTFRIDVPLDWEGCNERNERWTAVIGLIASRSQETDEILLGAVSDADPRVSEAAALGLTPSRRPETRTQMVALLKNVNQVARSRRRAAQWLGSVFLDASVPLFMQTYHDETERIATDPDNDELLRDLVRFLGAARTPAAMPVLLHASRNPDREVRLAAVHGLASLGGEQARDRLQDLSKNDYDEVINLAATRELDRLSGRGQDQEFPISPRR